MPAYPVIASAIDKQLDVVLGAIAASSASKPKRVHRLRVGLRRLLVALELADAVGLHVRPRARRTLKSALKALSPLRDTQVQLQTLREPSFESAPSGFARWLESSKRAQRRRVAKHLKSIDTEQLARDIALLRAQLAAEASGPRSAAELEAVAAALLGELSRRQLEIQERGHGIAEDDAERLHRTRVAFKHYRYAIELLTPLLPAEAREPIKTATALQDRLGTAHDRHVLADMARKYAKRSKRQRSKLSGWAEELARASAEAQREGVAALQTVGLDFRTNGSE